MWRGIVGDLGDDLLMFGIEVSVYTRAAVTSHTFKQQICYVFTNSKMTETFDVIIYQAT